MQITEARQTHPERGRLMRRPYDDEQLNRLEELIDRGDARLEPSDGMIYNAVIVQGEAMWLAVDKEA